MIMIYQLEIMREMITKYLKNAISDGDLNERSYYGESFAALSLLLTEDGKNEPFAETYLKLYKKKDKSVENFHWEFNNYALMKIRAMDKVKDIHTYLYPLHFKGTPCTNWTLLRAVCLAMEGDIERACEIAEKKIISAQEESGLIKDEENVESLQYHAFSALLLYELYELTGKKSYKERFIRAVYFSSNFVLSNGCSLFIGRGQEQIFGYGCLLYILTQGYLETGSKKMIFCLERVVKYIGSFCNNEGEVPLPLVLNRFEKNSKLTLEATDIRHLGWYPYNNYSDYIAFFCYYLSRTINLIKAAGINEIQEYLGEDNTEEYIEFKNRRYLVVKKKKYEAVLAVGGGYWTNDLQFPLIVANERVITPCYGGEQYAESLYSREQSPMPWGKISYPYGRGIMLVKNFIKTIIGIFDKHFFLRNSSDASIEKIDEDIFCLKIGFQGVIFRRIFRFFDDYIEVTEQLNFERRYCFERFYFFNLWFFEDIKIDKKQKNIFRISPKIILELQHEECVHLGKETGYCAMGTLKNLNISEDNVKIKKGKKYAIKYKILFT